MKRTKWLRLLVRDLGDVIRWAGAQDAREIGEFRYRVINGREIVSFRLVPHYAIEIGARDIIVVAHVRATGWRARAGDMWRAICRIGSAVAQRPRQMPAGRAALPMHAAALPAAGNAKLRPLPAAGWPAPTPRTAGP